MDIAKSKATADRLLAKVATIGLVTKKSDILGEADLSASVRVKIKTRVASPEQPVRCDAIMSATAFPVEGAELLLKDVTYDIVEVTQSGVMSEHVIQKVVLHER